MVLDLILRFLDFGPVARRVTSSERYRPTRVRSLYMRPSRFTICDRIWVVDEIRPFRIGVFAVVALVALLRNVESPIVVSSVPHIFFYIYPISCFLGIPPPTLSILLTHLTYIVVCYSVFLT